ncbi:S1C family serine protease [Catellatospora vulcania]|uniref:S1C family serine protease n=1 Tax=Catellatospora vulcania TaxID=1460450 RepID=UPI0012D47721|nr:trypsin-like peptidase domain-containing protein [Catellatospora vulcania]
MLSRAGKLDRLPDAPPPDATAEVEPVPAPRPWWRLDRRALVATCVAVALAVTAVVAFRWGAAGSSDNPAVVTPSPSPSDDGVLTVAEVYQVLLPSVVSIRSTGPGRTPSTASGTGVLANTDGTILTALHVVKGAAAIEVTYADGSTSAATVAAADPAKDIAALTPKTLPPVLVPAVLGGVPGIGEQVVAIGDQLGLTGSTTTGVVSGLERSVTVADVGKLDGLIQFDAAVNPGSSGGPLVNMRGETVGIVVALANPTEAGTFIGVGFAVPIVTAAAAGGPPPPL